MGKNEKSEAFIKEFSKDDVSRITHAQMENFLKKIPAGWTINFSRPVLRPDVLQMALVRSDKLQYQLQTTGGLLLENPEKNFLDVIASAIEILSKAKKESVKK